MEERIREILAKLLSVRSLTCSEAERTQAEWFTDFFKAMPYFQKHPEETGAYEIPDDPYGRSVPYALLRGKKTDTVVLSGHFDIVSSEEYGAAEDYAYRLGSVELERMLRDFPLTEEQRADLESGEWLWGRGVADMQGGLAIHAALFEEYARQAEAGTLGGSILFVPVPDEESYSAGMRSAVEVFRMLQSRYGLNYKLMIDPEPTREVDGTLVLPLGSVGKVMPTVLVQGKRPTRGSITRGCLPSACLRRSIFGRTARWNSATSLRTRRPFRRPGQACAIGSAATTCPSRTAPAVISRC